MPWAGFRDGSGLWNERRPPRFLQGTSRDVGDGEMLCAPMVLTLPVRRGTAMFLSWSEEPEGGS